MQRAVDGNHVALREHLLEGIHAAAANLGLLLGAQRLVVVVQQLLAVKRLEPAQHALADAADRHGAHHLALEVELVLGGLGHVPPPGLDHLVRGDEVADEHEDRHDDVLGDRDDVGARHFGDGDAAVGLVGRVEVDVVRADPGRDGELELLGAREALRVEVARVEGGGDDDFGVDELAVEFRLLAVLGRGRHEGVALVLEPFAQAELVFGGSEQLGDLGGWLLAIEGGKAGKETSQECVVVVVVTTWECEGDATPRPGAPLRTTGVALSPHHAERSPKGSLSTKCRPVYPALHHHHPSQGGRALP